MALILFRLTNFVIAINMCTEILVHKRDIYYITMLTDSKNNLVISQNILFIYISILLKFLFYFVLWNIRILEKTLFCMWLTPVQSPALHMVLQTLPDITAKQNDRNNPWSLMRETYKQKKIKGSFNIEKIIYIYMYLYMEISLNII